MRDADDWDAGRLHWFGQDWGDPLLKFCPQVPTPLGAPCLWCSEPIGAGESGVTQLCFGHDAPPTRRALHQECFVRGVIGGVNHIRGTCSCDGGADDPDPPELSRREAARAAVVVEEEGQ